MIKAINKWKLKRDTTRMFETVLRRTLERAPCLTTRREIQLAAELVFGRALAECTVADLVKPGELDVQIRLKWWAYATWPVFKERWAKMVVEFGKALSRGRPVATVARLWIVISMFGEEGSPLLVLDTSRELCRAP